MELEKMDEMVAEGANHVVTFPFHAVSLALTLIVCFHSSRHRNDGLRDRRRVSPTPVFGSTSSEAKLSCGNESGWTIHRIDFLVLTNFTHAFSRWADNRTLYPSRKKPTVCVYDGEHGTHAVGSAQYNPTRSGNVDSRWVLRLGCPTLNPTGSGSQPVP